jgi:hypothetical protein
MSETTDNTETYMQVLWYCDSMITEMAIKRLKWVSSICSMDTVNKLMTHILGRTGQDEA